VEPKDEVNKLGKIFDALEKSKESHETSVTNHGHQETIENGVLEKEASFNRSVSLGINRKSTTYSYETPKKVEKERQQERTASLSKDEVFYQVDNIDKNLVSLLKPQSFETEQFKILRTNLLFPTSGRSPRSIMITSAVPGEGKSFVSSNLAISIAQSIQEYVLLIDCDIRRPCVHTRFGFENVPGLSEHLTRGVSLNSLILKTAVNKLSILPGGRPPHNPSELLSSQHMSRLLQEVKNRYSDRYIVIDSPPPKLTAETSAISRQVDGVLIVAEYGRTPRNMVLDLIEIIGKDKILGVILNKLDMRFPGYYGLGKYGKYGAYYNH
jgi:protein-tyrosine kinase